MLYEFIAMLVRIGFQRANPTFGNFGDKAELVPLPGEHLRTRHRARC